MAVSRAMLVAGGGAVAAYALARASTPKGAPSDGGYTAPPPAPPSVSKAGDTARRAMRVPCGAPRVAYGDLALDGQAGATFAAEWASECRSLVARFGELTWLSIGTGRPELAADCVVAWIDVWLAAWWRARTAGGDGWARFRVWAGTDLNGEALVTDPQVIPELTLTEKLGEAGRSRLGRAWVELVAVRNLALWESGDRTSRYCRRAADGLKEFAAALDQAAAADVSGTALEEAGELVKGAAKGAAGALVWVAEEVLAPVIGAAGAAVLGTLLPYVVVGGVLYIVVRRAT